MSGEYALLINQSDEYMTIRDQFKDGIELNIVDLLSSYSIVIIKNQQISCVYRANLHHIKRKITLI